MCGIVGIFAKSKLGFYTSQISVFKELLYAGQLRGSDGTGVFYNSGNEVYTLKSPIKSSDFLGDPKVKKAMDSLTIRSTFVVGHNRSATKGGTTYLNTHPHLYKHIVLIHNGTLYSHKELADVESDSLAICKSIVEIGAEKTLEKIHGSFALVWYNTKEKTINICRNTERPLYLLEINNCYVIASEPKMAEWIIDRNKFHITSCISFIAGTLYKYSQDSFNLTNSIINLREPNFYCNKEPMVHTHRDIYDFYNDESRIPKSIPIKPPVPFKKDQTVSNLKEKQFHQKLGGLVYFKPEEIIQCYSKHEYYTKGYTADSKEVRVYSSNRADLQLLSCLNELVGELKSVAYIKNREVLFLKDVRKSFFDS